MTREKKSKRIPLSTDNLERVSGGSNYGTENADEICLAIGDMFTDLALIDTPKWPCPKCGSWNVGNYDPGVFFQMRVYCKDCGFFGCRDGEDDALWDPEIKKQLKEWDLL